MDENTPSWEKYKFYSIKSGKITGVAKKVGHDQETYS
jgi:hypothetical protein